MGNVNLWENITSKNYDLHMGHENVFQLQIQKNIIKEQFEIIPHEEKSAAQTAILGITNGNGLEAVDVLNMGSVIGIDVSKQFLNSCLNRYGYLGDKLKLYQIDLITEKNTAIKILNQTRLIIANIIIEHIHIDNFIAIIKDLSEIKRIISCVIQHNPDGSLTSSSGYEHTFDKILPMIEELEKQDVIKAMNEIGYRLIFEKNYTLPNKKVFIRLDFDK